MFEKILNSALNNELDLKKFKNWLCNQEEYNDIKINQQEFITYFLNYIRNETSRYVKSSTAQTVTKPEKESTVSKKQKSNDGKPPHNKSYDDKLQSHNKSYDGKLQTSFKTNDHKLHTYNKSYDSKPHTPHNKPYDGSRGSFNHEGNNSIHTSTPIKKFNKSYSGSEASFTDSQDTYSFRHRSADITLENYITENFYKNKKKKKIYSNNSPNTSIENEMSDVKSIQKRKSGPEDNIFENRENNPIGTDTKLNLIETKSKTILIESDHKIIDENRLEMKNEINQSVEIKPMKNRRVQLSNINNIEEYPILRNRTENFISNKSKNELSKTEFNKNKTEFNKNKTEFNKNKTECNKNKTECNKNKSELNKSKSDSINESEHNKSKSGYNKNKSEHNKSKSESIKLESTPKSRRIKPTILTESNNSTINNSNSFSFTENPEVSENVAEWRRNILQKEKEKIAARNSDLIISSPKYIKNNLYITPKRELVTNSDKLDILIAIYVTLLNNNLVLNVLSEIHFVSTLLLGNSDKNDTELNIFNTVHNCIYFASNVLQNQSHVLSLLNRPTLKLLIENERLKEFVPDLINQLDSVYNQKIEKKVELIFRCEQMSYISETDSRENFPTESSFHKFKKQRDLFYDILRTWETNHNQPEWVFNVSLKNKMNDLLTMHNDPANYYHLARLFKNQLLNSKTTNNDNDDFEKEMNMLDVSVDKLTKLKNRLVTKESHTDFQSDFPNKQEFYKEFIKYSHTNTIFIKHLENCLSEEIVTMEENFYTEELDIDCAGDTSNNNFISYLKSTKLLAKFLGYIEALPYKTDGTLNEQILKSFMNVRKMWSPVLDIEKHLTRSIYHETILLTLPWLIEYLSQLDYVSLQLPALKNVIEILFKIYFSRYLNRFCISSFLIKISIGSLFETNNFPRELFNEAMLGYINNDFKIEEKNIVIQLINEEVLYVCAPKLLGLKLLLSSGSAPVCMRVIRPVTNIITDVEAQKQKDQKILEDSFLHSLSENTKHMIDFVSQRVASATVKIIRKNYIEKSIKSTITTLNTYVEDNMTEDIENMTTFIKNGIDEATAITEKELLKIKSVCNETIDKIIQERCTRSIPALLHHDVHPLVAGSCVSIAVRKAKERVKDWIDRNITIALYMDPLTKELTKTPEDIHKEPPQITTYKTIEEYSLVKLLTDNKKFILTAHETPELLTQDVTETVLEYIKNTIQSRKDIGGSVKDAIFGQVTDIILAIIVHRPDLMKDNETRLLECIELFITKDDIKNKQETHEKAKEVGKGKQCKVYKGNPDYKKKVKELNIINVRNVYLLYEGPDLMKSWTVYKNFILMLLNNKILFPKEFEEQILQLFQQDYPEDIFNLLVLNMKQLVDDVSKSDGSEEILRAVACLTSYLVNEF